MTMVPSFWVDFEERAIEIVDDTPKTHTMQREEPDQRTTNLSLGTKTITEAREEDDQDPIHHDFCAIPIKSKIGTHTQTRTREEPDQDAANEGLHSIPILFATKTETATAQREEQDQDDKPGNYSALPRESGTA